MLFLSIDGVKASDLLEAFVKVAATTVGAVVAFAFYMLVLVALHVTKVVSHLMLFVGDFLDLLADELIVCIYKKADTIAAPSHSVRVFTRSHLQNITAEEEDASITPLPEHVLLLLPSHRYIGIPAKLRKIFLFNIIAQFFVFDKRFHKKPQKMWIFFLYGIDNCGVL